jgi:hypothetical protein
MPDKDKATVIGKSRIGVELTDEQCAVLSDLVHINE